MSLFSIASEAIHTALAHNQFLSGGLVLGAIGSVMAYARGLPHKTYNFLLGQFTVSLEIRSEDEAFTWFKEWLNEHPYSKRSRHHVLSTSDTKEGFTSSGGLTSPTSSSSSSGGKRRLLFMPAPGCHWFWADSRLYYVIIDRKDPSKDNDYRSSMSLTLKTWGRSTDGFKALTRKIQDQMEVSEDKGLRVYTNDHYGSGWTCASTRPRRSMESLVFDTGVLEDVVADSGHFLANEDWYVSKGIPWRRGYLLHGPAGTGKTSMAAAVANAHKLDVYYLSLSDTSDSKLMQTMSYVPSKAVVVIEEIDTVFQQRKAAGGEKLGETLTFGGLLNVLDGVVAKEGRIVIMTTNHPELLDPALVRPGRCDRRIELGLATKSQIQRQLQRFYMADNGNLPWLLLDAVVAAIPDRSVSMAALQEHCLKHRNSLKDFRTNLSQLVAEPLAVAA